MIYEPTEKDMEQAALLSLIADGGIKGEEAATILLDIFPNIDISWTKEDIQDYLTGVYQLPPIQVDRVIDHFPENYISPTTFNPIMYNFHKETKDEV